MTGNEVLDALPEWLRAASLELDEQRLTLYRAAVVSASKDFAGHEFGAVSAAFGALDEPTNRWLTGHLSAADDAYVADGKNALIERLSACVISYANASSVSDQAILAGLAVKSAGFLGWTPVVRDIATIVDAELLDTAKWLRRPDGVEAAATDTVGRLPKERKPDAETGVAVDVNELAGDVAVLSKGLKALVAHVDAVKEAADKSLRALQEETEIVWWLLLARDEQGTPWADHTAATRAVILAQELFSRSAAAPGPPSAAYFLERALGSEANTPLALRDFIPASAESEAPSATQTLLPILAGVSAYREVNGGDIWPELCKQKFGVDPSLQIPLGVAAAQLYRELYMQDIHQA